MTFFVFIYFLKSKIWTYTFIVRMCVDQVFVYGTNCRAQKSKSKGKIKGGRKKIGQRLINQLLF